jgi:hypothetical protein
VTRVHNAIKLLYLRFIATVPSDVSLTQCSLWWRQHLEKVPSIPEVPLPADLQAGARQPYRSAVDILKRTTIGHQDEQLAAAVAAAANATTPPPPTTPVTVAPGVEVNFVSLILSLASFSCLCDNCIVGCSSTTKGSITKS